MGERWDVGFIQGLRTSWIVVPVISTDALTPMERLHLDDDHTDNVLLEWIVALQCESIYPTLTLLIFSKLMSWWPIATM